MSEDYRKTKWTNVSWAISWLDDDHVLIEGEHGQQAAMTGGDFTSALSALSSAYIEGMNAGLKRAREILESQPERK